MGWWKNVKKAVGAPTRPLTKQLTAKKLSKTTGSLFNGVGRAVGDIASAPSRWAGDALHSANIINNRDWQNNTDMTNIMGQTVGNAIALPINISRRGGLGKFTHNPSSFLVDEKLKNTSAYRNMARPTAKTLSNVGIGYLTGGLAGAVVAGVGGAASGDRGSLGTDPYSPVTNVAAPAISGYAAGASDSGAAFNASMAAGDGVGTATSAALNAATDGAVGTAATHTVEGAASEAAVAGGGQVAANVGVQGAGAGVGTAAQAAQPTFLQTAGAYLSDGAGLAAKGLNAYKTVMDVANLTNPPAEPAAPQQQPLPQRSAYQAPAPQQAPLGAQFSMDLKDRESKFANARKNAYSYFG